MFLTKGTFGTRSRPQTALGNNVLGHCTSTLGNHVRTGWNTYRVGISLLRWKSIPLRRNPCVASAVDLLQRFAIICSLNPFTGRVCFNTPPVVPVTLVPWKVCRSTLEHVRCDPEGEAMSSSSQVYNVGTLRSLLRIRDTSEWLWNESGSRASLHFSQLSPKHIAGVIVARL